MSGFSRERREGLGGESIFFGHRGRCVRFPGDLERPGVGVGRRG